MSFKKKLILGLCIALLILVGSLSAAFLYLYHNPDYLKSLLEREISRYSESSLMIGDLSYSLRPIKIRARRIVLNPLDKDSGFHLQIPDFIADMTLEGPLGNRSLIIKRLKITGFSLGLNREMTLPEISLKGRRPSLFSRFLKGAIALLFFRDIQFEGGELVNGQIDARMGDQRIYIRGLQATLDPDHRVSISCSGELKWPSRKMGFVAPHITITTDRTLSLRDLRVKSLVTLKGATLQSPDGDMKDMELKADLIYDHNHKKLEFAPVDIQLGGVTLKHPTGINFRPLNFHIKAKGLLDLAGRHLEATDFTFRGEDILQLTGRLTMDFDHETSFRLQILDCRLLPEKIPPLLPAKIQVMLTPFRLEGAVGLKGGIQGIREQGKWEWACNLKARIEESSYSLTLEGFRLNGNMNGEINAAGRFPAVNISGKLEGDKTILLAKRAELRPFKGHLSFSGRLPLFDVNDLTVQIPQAKIGLGARDILIDDIVLQATQGHVNGQKRSLAFPEIRVDSSLAKNLLLAVDANEKQITLQLQGNDVHLIKSAPVLRMLPASWEYRGTDSIKLKASSKEDDLWDLKAMIGVKDLVFQNEDGTIMGEKIFMDGVIEAKIDLKGSKIDFHSSLELNKGEILYDRFYLNLNQTPFSSLAKGFYELQDRSLSLSNLQLVLRDLLTLNTRGNILLKSTDTYFDLALEIPFTPLKRLSHHFIVEPFGAEKPFLSELDMTGNISSTLKMAGSSKGWKVKGLCLWRDGELSSKDGAFSFKGIHLDLPIWYQTHKNSKDKEALNGRLIIQSLRLPHIPEQKINLSLDVGQNRIHIKNPITVQLPEGRAQIGSLIANDIFGPELSINTNLTLESIKLQPFFSKIWSRPLNGALNGKLDPVHYENRTLSSRGEVKADLFGGEILFNNIGASGIFTSAQVLRLDARWRNLLLSEITTDTSFGKIEGLLQGHTKDFEIAHGQPQRFDLLLETVKKKGIPQRISVKAVDNIAQIGGGQSPFMGMAGIFASFFKQFPYDKIGIRASLENDIFKINGTIREGGTEYLIKRGGISGVNVVNQNPDNRINFKDMVKRIKRITDSHGGPVVK
ncbi:MAG: hypothetical protein ABII26_07700 [Pseudomonadota bacterium]